MPHSGCAALVHSATLDGSDALSPAHPDCGNHDGVDDVPGVTLGEGLSRGLRVVLSGSAPERAVIRAMKR
ncbi:unnamed protein product [Boreogadus saida]